MQVAEARGLLAGQVVQEVQDLQVQQDQQELQEQMAQMVLQEQMVQMGVLVLTIEI